MRTGPVFQPLPEVRKYELVDDHFVAVDGRAIWIQAGFRTDGASIPWWAWWITCTPLDPRVMEGGLTHDWLYYVHATTRRAADRVLYLLLRANGLGCVKSWLMWAAVRAAGWLYWPNDTSDVEWLRHLYNRRGVRRG